MIQQVLNLSEELDRDLIALYGSDLKTAEDKGTGGTCKDASSLIIGESSTGPSLVTPVELNTGCLGCTDDQKVNSFEITFLGNQKAV